MNRYITISEQKIFYILFYFVNFSSVFSKFSFRAQMKYAAILFCGIYIFNNFRYVIEKRNKRDYLFILFLGIVIYSSWINNGNVNLSRPFLASILFSTVLLEDLFAFRILRATGKMDEMLKYWFYLMIVISVLAGLSIPFGSISMGTGFLLGDKFNMAYHHTRLVLLAFLVIRDDYKKRFTGLAIIYTYSIAIAVIVGCGTGVFELIIMLIFLEIKNYKAISNPVLQIVVLLLAASFLFINVYVLNNNLVTYIIVNIFKKQPTLTGRTVIYGNIIPLITNGLLSGYGYGTNYEVCMKGIGAVNAQNGLIKLVMETGIISAVVLLLYMFVVFLIIHQREDKKYIYPVLCFILALSIISSIEITVDSEYIMWLVFASAFVGEKMIKEPENSLVGV